MLKVIHYLQVFLVFKQETFIFFEPNRRTNYLILFLIDARQKQKEY